MALSATIRTVQIELSDVDRGVYDSLELKVAQHPSESDAYLAARLVALALEWGEGMAFSKGLSTTDEPPIWQHDLSGRLLAWIEVGTPSAARLHKASKAADRVAVYCHKRAEPWLRTLAGRHVHNANALALTALPMAVITEVGATLGRRNRWQLTRTEGTVYLDTDDRSFELGLTPLRWPVGDAAR